MTVKTLYKNHQVISNVKITISTNWITPVYNETQDQTQEFSIRGVR